MEGAESAVDRRPDTRKGESAVLAPGTRRLRMTVAYDGTDYAGFQRQPRLRTVQGALEEALSMTLREHIQVVAAGRTDAGVHALGQVVHFDSVWPGPPDRLVLAVAPKLPRDLAVRSAGLAAPGFHARYSARFRRYGYRFLVSGRQDPIRERFELRVQPGLDFEAMEAASHCLCGRHNFRSFMSDIGREEDPNPLRTVQRVRWRQTGQERLFVIQADGFLRHMVRNVVGALLAVGAGRLDGEEFAAILRTANRNRTFPPAGAAGLYLLHVGY